MKLKIAIVVTVCMLLAGCDSFTAEPYSFSADNDLALKQMGPANVAVTGVSAGSGIDMTCRLAGPIQLPGGVTPQDYVATALSDELKLAGLDNGTAPAVTLSGQLTQAGFSSMSGNWNLALTVTSSNGRSVAAMEQYGFSSSFSAEGACHDVADSFEPAVQALIGKLVSDPGFPALLKGAAQPVS